MTAPHRGFRHIERRSVVTLFDANGRAVRSVEPQREMRELTHRGTKMYGGYLWADPNPDMRRNSDAQAVYDEMERTDGVISGALMLIDETLRTARLSLEPANNSQLAARMADFCDWALNVSRKRRPTGQLLSEMIRPLQSFAPKGFAYAEIIPKAIKPLAGPFKGKQRIVVDRLAFCEQSAHDEWRLDKEGRQLIGITQIPVGDGSNRRVTTGPRTEGGRPIVPIQRLVRLAFQGYGHNYQGIALLRRCVFPWRAKNAAADAGVVAIERFGAPTPMVEIDRRAAMERGYSDTQVDDLIDSAIENVEHYVVDKRGYLLSGPGVTYGTFGGSGTIDSSHVVEFIKAQNREILLGLLAQFFTLGIGDVGSRSVGVIHRTVHARFVANLMQQMADAVTEQLIFPLCVAEYGAAAAAENAPRLVHHDIDSALLGEVLGLLPGLFQSGVLKHTQQLENEVLRTLLGAESAGAAIAASEAAPESARMTSASGVFKPGPGRPQGEG